MAGTKRKAEDSSTQVAVKSLTEDANVVVGAFFNGLDVGNDAQFELFKHKSKDQFELHGETETLEYKASSNEDEETHAYTLAVYDPSTKSMELFEAPMLSGKVISKSKRQYRGPKIKQLGIRNNLQRNALGEAFGTKKAKSAISNLERNRIDADKLQDLELDIVDSVKETTQDLPSRAQMEKDSSDLRPTPKINMGATNSEDIYPIENIIPKADWNSLRVQSILEANSDEKLEMLPFGKSNYLLKHIDTIEESKAKLLYYLSILLGIYHNRRVKDKATLLTKFKHQPSETLINNILHTFTINKLGKFGRTKDKSFFIDPHSEDKLLCYILAIIFHIDNFLVELQPLSYELNLKPNKLVNLCRIMGASVKPPTVGQAEALSIPKAMIATSKMASLKAPVRLPDMSKRARR